MRVVIDSQLLGKTFKFWAPDAGGYVYLEGQNSPGTSGRQICEGGGYTGTAVEVGPSDFDASCRRWYRAHIRRYRKMGFL